MRVIEVEGEEEGSMAMKPVGEWKVVVLMGSEQMGHSVRMEMFFGLGSGLVWMLWGGILWCVWGGELGWDGKRDSGETGDRIQS